MHVCVCVSDKTCNSLIIYYLAIIILVHCPRPARVMIVCTFKLSSTTWQYSTMRCMLIELRAPPAFSLLQYIQVHFLIQTIIGAGWSCEYLKAPLWSIHNQCRRKSTLVNNHALPYICHSPVSVWQLTEVTEQLVIANWEKAKHIDECIRNLHWVHKLILGDVPACEELN